MNPMIAPVQSDLGRRLWTENHGRLFLITYDLRAPGRDYKQLYDLLAVGWGAERLAESVWIAELLGPADVVRDMIRRSVDPNDRIIVVELSERSEWASIHGLRSGVDVLLRHST